MTEKTAMTSKEREALFVEMASEASGTTAQDVYKAACARGDNVTEESYFNLGRRLSHRGILVADRSSKPTRFTTSPRFEGQWLDEDHLASIINPDYPLIGLAALREVTRQAHNIPEVVWVELRERLRKEPARALFFQAIVAYCDNLRDEIEHYSLLATREPEQKELSRAKRQVEENLSLLKSITKYGLGLSQEAVNLPANLDLGLRWIKENPGIAFYSEAVLQDELHRRISNESIIVDIEDSISERDLIVAGVDGSSRGGLLTFEGESGDLTVGHAPMVSINTAVAQINRKLTSGAPVFMRLPEKPEDMQQERNRYTIMARLFFPDMTESMYAHSLWNSMDVLESRVALRVLQRWYMPNGGKEIPRADVVLRDGTITPNDRDSNHYAQTDSYGQIVRDLIETNWEIALKSGVNAQTVAGAIKDAQLRVFAPVLNWYACQLAAAGKGTQIERWPLDSMNYVTDQLFLTRLLTAGRKKSDHWSRSCLVLRPFHAISDFATRYSRSPGKGPVDLMLARANHARAAAPHEIAPDAKWFWSNFNDEGDPYLQMLRHVWYANFFIGCFQRMETERALPRFEFLVTYPMKEESPFPDSEVKTHLSRLLQALKKMGFEVAAEHTHFDSPFKIDVLPTILIQAHDTVKTWATVLLSRVQEFIGYQLSKVNQSWKYKGLRVRKWTAGELEQWVHQMQLKRDIEAGVSSPALEDEPSNASDSKP